MARYRYQHADGTNYTIDADDDAQAAATIAEIERSHVPKGSSPTSLVPGFDAVLETGIRTYVNPRPATEAAIQGLTTAGGAALGTPLGVPGQVAGGSLGNVAGRIINNAIYGEPLLPSPGQAVQDAVVGGIAPAVGPVLNATGRALVKGVTGQMGQAGSRRLSLQAMDLANETSGPAMQRAAQIAERTANRANRIARGSANAGTLLTYLGTGDAGSAALVWGAGHGARWATQHVKAIERAFMSPRFVDWLRNQPAAMSRRQIARNIAAAGSTAGGTEAMGLSQDEAQALVDSAPRPVFQRGTMKWHDPDTGRIIGAGTVGIDGWTVVDGERVRRATADDMLVSRAPDPDDDQE